MMDHGQLAVFTRIIVALVIGGIIGLERTFHGRPAGFRTHSLVCVASALLMLVTVYQSDWMTSTPVDTIRTDPTRMVQGIMTGIGFLGDGHNGDLAADRRAVSAGAGHLGAFRKLDDCRDRHRFWRSLGAVPGLHRPGLHCCCRGSTRASGRG